MSSKIPFVENRLYKIAGSKIEDFLEKEVMENLNGEHFFTETGLASFLKDMFQNKPINMGCSPISIQEFRLTGTANHRDRHQMICDFKKVEHVRDIELNLYFPIEKRRGVIFWDFDGTLAHSTPLWGRAAREALASNAFNHSYDLDKLKILFEKVFPWHKYQVCHLEQIGSEQWWPWVEQTFYECFLEIGAPSAIAKKSAVEIKEAVLDPFSYRIIDGTIEILARLKEAGWRHVVISNHVPELPSIVESLGLGMFFDHVISSGNIGFEKPHPGIFEHAIQLMNSKDQDIWMIGDNPIADIEGARQFGMRGILVKNPMTNAANALELAEVLSLIPYN